MLFRMEVFSNQIFSKFLIPVSLYHCNSEATATYVVNQHQCKHCVDKGQNKAVIVWFLKCSCRLIFLPFNRLRHISMNKEMQQVENSKYIY